MNKLKKTFIFLMIIFYTNILLSWEVYDQVVAVVNSVPIVESEILEKLAHEKRLKNIPASRLNYEKSRILDKFIEDSLLMETAKEESIIISDIRIIDHVEKIMMEYFSTRVPRNNLEKVIADVKKRVLDYIKGQKLDPKKKIDSQVIQFEKFIYAKQKLNLKSLFEELRLQMRKDQVMSIAIGVSPPSLDEAKKWYSKNKHKLGFEMKIKHILIKPKMKSIDEERKVNKLMADIRNRIVKGESFEKLARKYSQDPGSAQNGGDLGWVMLQNLDRYFANNIFQMNKSGQISKIFKSSYGYHIVKFLGKRAITFEKAERFINQVLYQENLQVQFKKWVKTRKEESEIRIYMKNYIKKI